MKRIIMIVILGCLMAGCTPEPSGKDFEEARSWCDEFGGYKSITYGSVEGLRARCFDGTLIIRDATYHRRQEK